jgi:tetratricopeptide (TPR) repeat protein
MLLLARWVGAVEDHGRAESPKWISSKQMLAGHEKWLECQNDSQCTIVTTHSCGYWLAINKNYLDEARKSNLQDPGCLHTPVYPIGAAAKCRNNECVLILPEKDNNAGAAIFWDRGQTLFKKRDFRAAQKYFQRVMLSYPTSPNGPEAFFYNAECYFFLKQFENAASAYKSFYERFPKDGNVPQARDKEALCLKSLDDARERIPKENK